MYFDFSRISANSIYHLVTQSLIPRPIAWVLTDSGEQNYNLAPFSYFTAVSSAPPLLLVSIGKKPNGDDKDTFVNLVKGSKAVVHIASAEQYKEVTATAATLPLGESEVDANNLRTTEFDEFELPRLTDCRIAFACRLYQSQKVGDTDQNLVLLEIEKLYVDDNVIELSNERASIDAKKISPLSRLGANQYGSLGEIIKQNRPK